jgi:hypothetical protein
LYTANEVVALPVGAATENIGVEEPAKPKLTSLPTAVTLTLKTAEYEDVALPLVSVLMTFEVIVGLPESTNRGPTPETVWVLPAAIPLGLALLSFEL